MAATQPGVARKHTRDFIPVEEVQAKVGNRYQTVMIAAKEARRVNALAKSRGDKYDQKVTSIALENLLKGRLKYYDTQPGVQQTPETGSELPTSE